MNIKVTISDLRSKKLNKYSKTEAFNNCIFENHPKKILQNSEKIIYTPGIIKDDTLYIKVLRNKKIYSEIDLFSLYNNWPKDKIISITGSKGKSTCCKYVKKKLQSKKKFTKIFIAGRKNLPLTSLPNYKKGYFLIAEIDYQLLAMKKLFYSNYNIITNIIDRENYYFSHKYYKKIKLSLISQKFSTLIYLTNKVKKQFDFTSKKNIFNIVNYKKDNEVCSKKLAEKFVSSFLK